MSDICPLPLYHGTSTIFLPSILEHGLGGINVVKEWKILELAREIFPDADNLFHQDCINSCFTYMVEQKIFNSVQNFQHGEVYLSPSKQKAAGYPYKRKWGAELLTATLFFLKKIIEESVLRNDNNLMQKYQYELHRKYESLYNLLETQSIPILIEVKGIDYCDLLNEDGTPVDSSKKEHIKTLMECIPDPDAYEEILQCDNFRLKKIISKDKLKISYIGAEHTMGWGDKYIFTPM